jgi:CBS domain-containing protein
MLKIRDIMTSDPITVSPGTSLRDAMELFTREHISGAPVSSGGKLVGVISASDLMAFAAAPPENGHDPESDAEFLDLSEIGDDVGAELAGDTLSDGAFFTDLLSDADTEVDRRFAAMSEPAMDALDEFTVADAMTTSVKAIGPDETATAAARLMQKAGVHRLLVMDRGRLAGIISTTDLNRAVAEGRLPDVAPVADTSTDFDSGWSHEPIVPYDDSE